MIWVGAERAVGTLDRESDSYLFAYDRLCPVPDAVSLTMPVSLRSYDYNDLHPVFQMNLPEGELREAMYAKFRKVIEGFDDFDMLRFVGTSQIGRLRFSNDAAVPSVPAQNIDEILRAKGTLDLKNYLLETFLSSSGVSGMQPKVLVRDDKADHPDVDKMAVRGATHIIKTFDAVAYPDLARNEFFCMRAAKYAGLPVPEINLSDNGQFLVVKRFDLIASGEYLGFEDFCSLSALGSRFKYDASYEMLATRIKQFVSPEEQKSALHQYFTSLVLSCGVRNGDAHLKNFGVLYPDTTSAVKYSPTYDIVTTTVYSPFDTMALTLNGTKAFPAQRELLSFGTRSCHIAPLEILQIIENVSDSIARARLDVQQHMSDTPEFVEMGTAMLKQWEGGVGLINEKSAARPTSRNDHGIAKGLW
jgi:serine/threonine-protein kinase HipA